jgi:hypothetical protein
MYIYIYILCIYIYIPFVHMPYLSPLTSHEYPIKAPNEISLSHLGQGPESLGAASGRSGPGCDHRKVMFNKRKWAKVSVFMIGDFKRLIYIYIYIYIYISIYIHNCSTFVVEPSCFHVLLLSFPPEITQKSTRNPPCCAQAAHRAALAAGMGTRQSAFAAARAVPRARSGAIWWFQWVMIYDLQYAAI